MSTTKRIVAILVIFVFTTIAWMILGGSIFARTYNQDQSLRSRVFSTWGTAQNQAPPTASFQRILQQKRDYYQNGQRKTRIVESQEPVSLPVNFTNANVNLHLDHRQKG